MSHPLLLRRPPHDAVHESKGSTLHIAIAGGTGILGAAVAEELVGRGHDVRALSRTPPLLEQPGVRHHEIDMLTGAGMGEGLAGAEVVIDASNTRGSGRKATPVLIDGARRLLEAEASANLAHHVAISIVGVDVVPLSYYRVKRAQEQVVEEGPIGWSILRATQFHELLDWIFATTARAGIVPGMGFALAPVDPRFVARALADAAERGPGGRLTPVAGPESTPLGDLARSWACARGRRVAALPLPLSRGTRRVLAAGALVPGEGAITGGRSFVEWLGAADRMAVTS